MANDDQWQEIKADRLNMSGPVTFGDFDGTFREDEEGRMVIDDPGTQGAAIDGAGNAQFNGNVSFRFQPDAASLEFRLARLESERPR